MPVSEEMKEALADTANYWDGEGNYSPIIGNLEDASQEIINAAWKRLTLTMKALGYDEYGEYLVICDKGMRIYQFLPSECLDGEGDDWDVPFVTHYAAPQHLMPEMNDG